MPRCGSGVWVHRARNVLAKAPKNAQAQVKADYWAIFDVPDKIEPGLDAVGTCRSGSIRRKALARLLSGGGAVLARRP